MPSFAARSNELEQMEAGHRHEQTLVDVLGDLARTNTVTLARPPTLGWLARATRSMPRGTSFTLHSTSGSGQGDMLLGDLKALGQAPRALSRGSPASTSVPGARRPPRPPPIRPGASAT